MDIRLIFKLLITGAIVSVIFASCKSTHNINDLDVYYGNNIIAAERMKGENEAAYWIRVYKQKVFYNCLTQNFKNDSVFYLMSKEDFVSKPSDIVSFPYWPKIREVGKNAIRYMKENDFISDEPELVKNKNFISGTCLNYLMSRELDSIAKNEYKSYLKQEKENEKMFSNKKNN